MKQQEEKKMMEINWPKLIGVLIGLTAGIGGAIYLLNHLP